MAQVPLITVRPCLYTGDDGVTRPVVLLIGPDGQHLCSLCAVHIASFLTSARVAAITAQQAHTQLAEASEADRALFSVQAEGQA